MEQAAPAHSPSHPAQPRAVSDQLRDHDALYRCGDNNKCTELILDLEIYQKNSKKTKSGGKITITVETRATPATPVVTLFAGDSTQASDSVLQTISDLKSISDLLQRTSSDHCGAPGAATPSDFLPSSKTASKCSKLRSATGDYPVLREICYYAFKNKSSIMSSSKRIPKNKKKTSKIDKATLIITNSSSEESVSPTSLISELTKRIENLEQKLNRQEITLQIMDKKSIQSHSTNPLVAPEPTHHNSFIGQYSHVPETSGFQREPTGPPAAAAAARRALAARSSEQYGREFTTYDGITDTRQRRRESASMPLHRVNAPDASHALKGRNKQAVVRDYRLMDCVHYLAQGEFAPRNDGIKLTPSREAVLSDIIWEDVCRSHWPAARLTRRGVGKLERLTHRSDLQRQIDGLLRERITHIERRRRRHYRVMKMNQGGGSGRPVGKTGDIIVASNRNPSKYEDENERAACSKGSGASPAAAAAGPHASKHSETSTSRRRAATSGVNVELPRLHHEVKTERTKSPQQYLRSRNRDVPESSAGSEAESRPRLVVGKKEPIRRKGLRDLHPSKEHYILLPTLVVKTSSNFRKQKYNQLYRALKLEQDPTTTTDPNPAGPSSSDKPKCKKRPESGKKEKGDV